MDNGPDCRTCDVRLHTMPLSWRRATLHERICLVGLPKKMNGGYLSLSEGLRTVFLVFALGFLLQTLFTYVLFNYIDVPFRDALTQAGMKKAESLMKRLGASENQIEEAMKNANDPKNNSFGNTLLSYAVLCVIFFIISLIIAAIIRKKKPAFENSFNQ
jgi:hypothetical protein